MSVMAEISSWKRALDKLNPGVFGIPYDPTPREPVTRRADKTQPGSSPAPESRTCLAAAPLATIVPVPENRHTEAEDKATRIDPHLPACPRMAYASPGQETSKEDAPG